MDAVIMNSAGDYNRRIGNPKRNSGTNRTSIPYRSDDLLLASFLAGGHFGGGGGLVFRPPQNLHHYRQQPPLLPLPVSTPLNHQNINISRSNSTSNNNIRLSSSPRINKNIKNLARDYSLTPKKSKNQKKDSKKDVADLLPPAAVTEEKEAPMTAPDPKDLPDEVVISRVLSSSINKKFCDMVSVDVVDEFSGSAVFTPSPPPSSLPFPTFCLRSKLSCKAEGSGVDVGATDSLRRLLRL